jgi:hypothetical protein
MRRLIIVLAAASLLMAGLSLAELPQDKQQELTAAGITDWTPGQNAGAGPAHAALTKAIQTPGGSAEDTATMTYDSGAITALPIVFGQIYGNRFSLGISSVALSTITLNSFSFYFAEDSVVDTNLFFQPASPGTTPGMIHSRASVNIGTLVNAGSSFSMLTTINVIPQSALATTGMFFDTFYLGAWCLNANTTLPVDNEAIGLDTNGPRQQGYTAASGGATASVAMAPQAFNAVLRANVTSPNLVPVELMAFDAE